MTGKLQTVGVLGATGYAGFELARLLGRHPRLAPPLLFSRNAEAESLAAHYPQLNGNGACTVTPFSWEAAEKVEVLFLATPHETSWELAPEARARGIKVVDLSGAWRLKEALNRAVYGLPESSATEKTIQSAVYGLPELDKNLLQYAGLVANPGCYATSVILGLAPLVRAELLDLSAGVICDCKSGVSGAGKQPTQKTHFVEVAENLSAYSVFGHRHTGEILEQLGLDAADLVFTPHLLPIARGILSTIYVRLKSPLSADAVEKLYRAFYVASRFVRIFAPPQLPQIRYSTGTNYCDIGFAMGPERRMVIVSCLDNLMKGAAGQAVQNMNLMMGWPEWEGLN